MFESNAISGDDKGRLNTPGRRFSLKESDLKFNALALHEKDTIVGHKSIKRWRKEMKKNKKQKQNETDLHIMFGSSLHEFG